MLVQSIFKNFKVLEHRIGIETLFQAVAARNRNKLRKCSFFALRCARCTPVPLVEEATTCKPTSDT